MSLSHSVGRLAAVAAAALLVLTAVTPPPVGARDPDRVRRMLPRPPAEFARVLHGGLARIAVAEGPAASPGDRSRAARTLAGMITEPGPGSARGATRVAVSITAVPGRAEEVARSVVALGGRVANQLDPIVEAYIPTGALAQLVRLPQVGSLDPIVRRSDEAPLQPDPGTHPLIARGSGLDRDEVSGEGPDSAVRDGQWASDGH